MHFCYIGKLSQPILLIVTTLLNTEPAQNLVLKDCILAKCDQWQPFFPKCLNCGIHAEIL